jgi:acyl transferase domain-containing protein
MNGHSSLEDYSTPPATVARDHLFVLSGHSENACRKIAANLTQYAAKILTSDLQDSILNDLAFSLARRSALRYRIAFTCSDAEDFIERLGSIEGRDIEPQLSLPNPRLAFVFTGQGAQWYGMGQELLESCATFQDSMRRASYSLTKLGCDWHLQTELHQSAKTSRVDDPAVGQPICTAIQISLVDALRSLGLRPIAVVGHSSGEIAAAYAAGAVSFEDAIAISYHRGRLVNLHGKTSEAKGAMLAVGETPERVTKLIAEVPSHLGSMVVACINSPGSVTVSGDKAAVEQLRGDLDREQVFNRLLKTNDVAYHSHQMRPLAQEYLRALSHIEGRIPDPSVRWISSVTGQYLGSQVVGPKYWVDNLVSPVLFAQALEKTCVDRTLSDPLTIDTIVEIGPHSTLAGPVKQTLKSVGEEARHVVYSNALTRHKNAVTTFVDMLGTLFVRGHPVDIKRISTVFGQTHGKLLADLPNYPWDHDTKYWHETRLSSEYRNRVFPRHERLGVRAPNFNVLEPSWRNYIRLARSRG